MSINTDILNDLVLQQIEENDKIAVQNDGLALEFVKSQTDEICKLAVRNKAWALKFVESQTEEICKLAIQQNWLSNKIVMMLCNLSKYKQRIFAN